MDKPKELVGMKENLASLAHDQWSGWMNYMFSKCTHNPDGSVTIPPDLVERWTRQMNTDYIDLPENEKTSDRQEAYKMLMTFVKNLPS